MEPDYKTLLIKYIQHVAHADGHYYIPDPKKDTKWNGLDHAFNEEEATVIRNLAYRFKTYAGTQEEKVQDLKKMITKRKTKPLCTHTKRNPKET